MKRRDFVFTSGSAILTGAFGLSQTQRSAVGVNFELSGIPEKNPKNINHLTVNFTKLEITPEYLDESESVTVKTELDVDSHGRDESSEIDVSVTNGETKQLSGRVEPIIVDGINTEGGIFGTVTVTVDHSDIQDSYSRRFNINDSEIPNSVDNRWTADEGTGSVVANSIGSTDISHGDATWTSDTTYNGGVAINAQVGNVLVSESTIDLGSTNVSFSCWVEDVDYPNNENALIFGLAENDISNGLRSLNDGGWGLVSTSSSPQSGYQIIHGTGSGRATDLFSITSDPSVEHLMLCYTSDGNDYDFYVMDTEGNTQDVQSGTLQRATTTEGKLQFQDAFGDFVKSKFDDITASTDTTLSESDFRSIANSTGPNS